MMSRFLLLSFVFLALAGSAIPCSGQEAPKTVSTGKEKPLDGPMGPANAQIAKLFEHAAQLQAKVKTGELTEQDAFETFRQHFNQISGKNQKPLMQPVDLKALGARLKTAVADGKMTKEEAIDRYTRAAAMAGQDKMVAPKAEKGTGSKGGANNSFYSIVIGRLVTKDIEIGEFTMEVDYVTSIYGDRRLKETIMGKTVKVVGISGIWIDKLLLMKRGDTLKLRSGTLDGTTISLSPKATVLERAAPFDRDTYPIPPESFRGFQGIVLGQIESKSDQGYDLTLRVQKVENSLTDSKASKPDSIEGRLISMQGFFNTTFRSTFDDLRIGDTIRVGAAHRVPEIDSLEVMNVLEKVEKSP
ncbi:MAG: hypothetical protein VX738_13855 [Planctomycetota bacterium]|nr:hypothetical protein [Planctomycetota bacterium]